MDENKYQGKSETNVPQNKEVFPETASDFEFLQEKIKERPINKKKLLKRMVITASLAVLFGVLACLSFLLLEPILNNWLYPEEKPGIVTFPQEQDEMRPEDMLTEGTTTSQETETQTVISEEKKDVGQEESAKGNDGKEDTMEGGYDSPIVEENIGESHSETQPEESAEVETMPIEPLKPYQTQYEELF